jgi:NAD(P)-dependent dehydrogenase (short-subunit alcohol dehydrogenase family)
VLVNNAVARQAIRRDGTVVDADRAAWQDALDVDLLAAAELCRLLIPDMIAGGHGSIINITSTAVELGYPRLAAYSACKAGLEALARQISADFGRQGVRANVIQPGSLVHEVRDHGNEKRLQEIRARCLTRPVEAHDIALAVVFLASRESEVITGVVLPIDGGMSTVIPTTI